MIPAHVQRMDPRYNVNVNKGSSPEDWTSTSKVKWETNSQTKQDHWLGIVRTSLWDSRSSIKARSPGGLPVFSAEESDKDLSGRLASSSRGSFSLVKGSVFDENVGPSCFSVFSSSGSASFESRKDERRRLTALVLREAISVHSVR